jgi:hypothetical protein
VSNVMPSFTRPSCSSAPALAPTTLGRAHCVRDPSETALPTNQLVHPLEQRRIGGERAAPTNLCCHGSTMKKREGVTQKNPARDLSGKSGNSVKSDNRGLLRSGGRAGGRAFQRRSAFEP